MALQSNPCKARPPALLYGDARRAAMVTVMMTTDDDGHGDGDDGCHVGVMTASILLRRQDVYYDCHWLLLW